MIIDERTAQFTGKKTCSLWEKRPKSTGVCYALRTLVVGRISHFEVQKRGTANAVHHAGVGSLPPELTANSIHYMMRSMPDG
jgi:hypothetical protein